MAAATFRILACAVVVLCTAWLAIDSRRKARPQWAFQAALSTFFTVYGVLLFWDIYLNPGIWLLQRIWLTPFLLLLAGAALYYTGYRIRQAYPDAALFQWWRNMQDGLRNSLNWTHGE